MCGFARPLRDVHELNGFCPAAPRTENRDERMPLPFRNLRGIAKPGCLFERLSLECCCEDQAVGPISRWGSLPGMAACQTVEEAIRTFDQMVVGCFPSGMRFAHPDMVGDGRIGCGHEQRRHRRRDSSGVKLKLAACPKAPAASFERAPCDCAQIFDDYALVLAAWP